MKDYASMTDEQLRRLSAEENDKDATDFLLGRYKDLVRRKARAMYVPGSDTEDLIQEGMIGLFEAIRGFSEEGGASFRTFAELCVMRHLYTAVEAGSRKKNIPLNTAVSIYEEFDSADGSGDQRSSLSETLENPATPDPERQLIDRENVDSLLGRIEEELSPFEKQVLELYIEDPDYTKIARRLGRSEKSTDNALQRIRRKLKQNG
ncbi:MAG: sigma-70 family RNA polymerase sigma factor [Lachnospiraceae bacterium]|nr:sigma-70 family RNA polymerase sigma factor [Lachnospiraceae bacterium]